MRLMGLHLPQQQPDLQRQLQLWQQQSQQLKQQDQHQHQPQVDQQQAEHPAAPGSGTSDAAGLPSASLQPSPALRTPPGLPAVAGLGEATTSMDVCSSSPLEVAGLAGTAASAPPLPMRRQQQQQQQPLPLETLVMLPGAGLRDTHWQDASHVPDARQAQQHERQ